MFHVAFATPWALQSIVTLTNNRHLTMAVACPPLTSASVALLAHPLAIRHLTLLSRWLYTLPA